MAKDTHVHAADNLCPPKRHVCKIMDKVQEGIGLYSIIFETETFTEFWLGELHHQLTF